MKHAERLDDALSGEAIGESAAMRVCADVAMPYRDELDALSDIQLIERLEEAESMMTQDTDWLAVLEAEYVLRGMEA